jgi:cation transport protein ChaC
LLDYNEDIWIFAYGSLMWRPEFPFIDNQPALLRGYHRSLCVYSIEHRGTLNSPGLVLGLDRGGACKGRAMRVAHSQVINVLKYLHKREMKNEVYTPRWLPVITPIGKVEAYCFVVVRNHKQYTGKLQDDEMLKLIRQGRGKSGNCLEYLHNTIHQLNELGIDNGPLHRIVRLAKNT